MTKKQIAEYDALKKLSIQIPAYIDGPSHYNVVQEVTLTVGEWNDVSAYIKQLVAQNEALVQTNTGAEKT